MIKNLITVIKIEVNFYFFVNYTETTYESKSVGSSLFTKGPPSLDLPSSLDLPFFNYLSQKKCENVFSREAQCILFN